MILTQQNPKTLSQEVVHAFDAVNGGVHPGFRPAHAKGILLTGVFSPSAAGSALTRARHVQNDSTPITVRFSDFAGIPAIPIIMRMPARVELLFAFIWENMFTRTSLPTQLMDFHLGPRKNLFNFLLPRTGCR